MRLHSHDVTIAPSGQLTWAHDVFGNTVAAANFADTTSKLIIESVADVELNAEAWPIFSIAASAVSYPFQYSDNDKISLGALTDQEFIEDAAAIKAWALKFIFGVPTDTLSLLKDLSAGVASEVIYDIRDEEGTQSPMESLARGRGSCRDLAVLYVEAARSLGIGGRLVSGYLYDPHQNSIGSAGSGSTHAWAELYVPGAGWITFDPTNRTLGGANLIPVAVGRTMPEIMPVVGSFAGPVDALANMSVEVTVRVRS